jgi:hypothetical protein
LPDDKRWTVYDHFGNSVYLTDERWQHIIDPINHPEMVGFEDELKVTIQQGNRKQDSLNNLPKDNTHIVAIVLFRLRENETGELVSNNYIVTAYQKVIG